MAPTRDMIVEQFAGYDKGPNPLAVNAAAIRLTSTTVFADLRAKLEQVTTLIGTPNEPVDNTIISEDKAKELNIALEAIASSRLVFDAAVEENLTLIGVHFSDVVSDVLSDDAMGGPEVVLPEDSDLWLVMPDRQNALVVRLWGELRQQANAVFGRLSILQPRIPYALKVATKVDRKQGPVQHGSSRGPLRTESGGKPVPPAAEWEYFDV